LLIKYLFYFIAKGRFSSNGRRGRPPQPSDAAVAAQGMAVDGFAAQSADSTSAQEDMDVNAFLVAARGIRGKQ